MVSFYTVYLLIMYFNPKIEAYLYKITKTTTPEYKSDLHEQKLKKENGSDGRYELLNEKQDEEKVDDDNTEDKKDNLLGRNRPLPLHNPGLYKRGMSRTIPPPLASGQINDTKSRLHLMKSFFLY